MFIIAESIRGNALMKKRSGAIHRLIRGLKIFCQTVWAFLYGFYSITALSWISIYSVLTVKNSHWMTRDLKSRAKR